MCLRAEEPGAAPPRGPLLARHLSSEALREPRRSGSSHVNPALMTISFPCQAASARPFPSPFSPSLSQQWPGERSSAPIWLLGFCPELVLCSPKHRICGAGPGCALSCSKQQLLLWKSWGTVRKGLLQSHRSLCVFPSAFCLFVSVLLSYGPSITYQKRKCLALFMNNKWFI